VGCAGALGTSPGSPRDGIAPHRRIPSLTCLPLGRVEAGLAVKMGLNGNVK